MINLLNKGKEIVSRVSEKVLWLVAVYNSDDIRHTHHNRFSCDDLKALISREYVGRGSVSSISTGQSNLCSCLHQAGGGRWGRLLLTFTTIPSITTSSTHSRWGWGTHGLGRVPLSSGDPTCHPCLAGQWPCLL